MRYLNFDFTVLLNFVSFLILFKNKKWETFPLSYHIIILLTQTFNIDKFCRNVITNFVHLFVAF